MALTDSTVVLVHGSWHGSWCWSEITPLLEASGHRVTALDMPGRGDPTQVASFGLADFTATVIDAVREAGGNVVLVGHSMGGLAVSQVAEQIPDLITGLLYIAAFVPGDGQSGIDLLRSPECASSLALTPRIDPVTGAAHFPVDLAREAFYAEVPEATAEACIERLVPETRATAATPIRQSPGGIGRVRRGYVECLRDRATPLAAQRAMYRAAGISTIYPLDTDHSPFVSRPTELTEIINDFITRWHDDGS